MVKKLLVSRCMVVLVSLGHALLCTGSAFADEAAPDYSAYKSSVFIPFWNRVNLKHIATLYTGLSPHMGFT